MKSGEGDDPESGDAGQGKYPLIARGSAPFAEKTLERLRVRRQVFGQEFQRDKAAEVASSAR
jgi:hypothetical protein